MPGMSIEEGINQVFNFLRHVVILGAGASIASTMKNPELNGKRLPSMDNFASVVGLEDIIASIPAELRDDNFEKLYGNLHRNDPSSAIISEIENRIQIYFADMQLPEEPTIYDYLILALRGKDLIATFNWDPFLYQAFCRNSKFTKDLPHISFYMAMLQSVIVQISIDLALLDITQRKTGDILKPQSFCTQWNKRTTITINLLVGNGIP